MKGMDEFRAIETVLDFEEDERGEEEGDDGGDATASTSVPSRGVSGSKHPRPSAASPPRRKRKKTSSTNFDTSL